MRPAYPLFSGKYYTDLYYSTLTPLLSDAPTRYSFLSLRPKMTPDEHKCRGRGRERERERQVTARCNCFFFFLLVLFFSSRFFSFRFVLFLFSSVYFFFAPLFSKFTQSLHGNAKCEWRVAMRSFLLEGWSKPDLAVFCIDGTPLLLHCCICFLRREILFLRISVHFDRRDLNTSRLF